MKKHLTKILCLFPTAFVSTIAMSSISSCKPYNINSIVIDGYSMMHMYDVQTFYAIIKPQDKPTHDVQWSVSDVSKGTINKKTGEFTALAMGSVTITATWTHDKKFTATKEITILEPSPQSIQISGNDTVRVGNNAKYTAEVDPEYAPSGVNWLISAEDQDKAKIDANGLLHARKTGNITIFAQSVYDPNIIGFKNITIDVPIAKDFRSDSWDSILYFIENGGYEALYDAYKNTPSFIANDNSFVGLIRKLPITINNKTVDHDVVVIGVNHDNIYDSPTNAKAALTFEFKNLLWDGEDTDVCHPMYIRWNPPLDYGKELNYWYLNENLYSEIRLQLSTKVKDLIDAGLDRTEDNSPLKTVVKITNTGGDDKVISEQPIESHDKVFILSLSEVYSDIGINSLTHTHLRVIDIYEEWDFYKQEGERYEYWEKRIGDNSPALGYYGDAGTNAFAPGVTIEEVSPNYSGYWFRSPRLRSMPEPYSYQDDFYKNCFACFPGNSTSFPEDNFDFVELSPETHHPAWDIGVLPCFCI